MVLVSLLLTLSTKPVFAKEVGVLLLGTVLNKPAFLVFDRKKARIPDLLKHRKLFSNILFYETEYIVPKLIRFSSRDVDYMEISNGINLKGILAAVKPSKIEIGSHDLDSYFVSDGKKFDLSDRFFKSLFVGSSVIDFSLNIENACSSFTSENGKVYMIPPQIADLLKHRRFETHKPGEQSVARIKLESKHSDSSLGYGIYYKNTNTDDLRNENLTWLPAPTIKSLNYLNSEREEGETYQIQEVKGRFKLRISFHGKRLNFGQFLELEKAIIVRNLVNKAFYGRLLPRLLPNFTSYEQVTKELESWKGKGIPRTFKDLDSYIAAYLPEEAPELIKSYWQPLSKNGVEIETYPTSGIKITVDDSLAEIVDSFYIERRKKNNVLSPQYSVAPTRAFFGQDLFHFSKDLFDDFSKGTLSASQIKQSDTDYRLGNLVIISDRELKTYRNSNPKKEGTSRHRGVYYKKDKKKWEVIASIERNKIRSLWDDEDIAGNSYDTYAICLYRSYAKLNFPAEDYNVRSIRDQHCKGIWRYFKANYGIDAEKLEFTNQRWLDALLANLELLP